MKNKPLDIKFARELSERCVNELLLDNAIEIINAEIIKEANSRTRSVLCNIEYPCIKDDLIEYYTEAQYKVRTYDKCRWESDTIESFEIVLEW